MTQLLINTLFEYIQESRAVARKTRNATAVLFGLEFTDDIHCNFKSTKTFSKHTGAKQNLTQNGDSRSFKVIQGHVFWGRWKGDNGLNNLLLYNNFGLLS